MLKIRKYIEGEVIEIDFMGANSRPITQLIKDQVANAINSSKTIEENYLINNLHLRDHIDTGVLYKDLMKKIELAIMGPREIYMPLLANPNKRVKVITPPLYIHVNRDNVFIGIRPENVNAFNPYTNVFDGMNTTNFKDIYGKAFTFSLPRVCLGSGISNKVQRDFGNGSYKALNVLIDWLVSTPNHDLNLRRSFSMTKFERYFKDALNNEFITKEQIANIRDLYSDNSSELSTDRDYMDYEYDYMLTLHSAISEIAPNIASDFLVKSYIYGSENNYRHNDVVHTLNKLTT